MLIFLIYHTGAGYDQIDIPACTAAGIYVSHTPTAVDAATADTALFLILGALRLFNSPLHALRAGSWRGGPPPPPLGHDPEGKVLGILGMGGIGRELKRKAEVGLGMTVQYYNRHELDSELAAGATYVSFETLLATSDVISLNLPLNVSGTLSFATACRGGLDTLWFRRDVPSHIQIRLCLPLPLCLPPKTPEISSEILSSGQPNQANVQSFATLPHNSPQRATFSPLMNSIK